MNKKIVLSGLSAFSALSLVVGATYAFFSDVGTSNDNVFSVSANAFDLKLTDDNQTAQDNVTASFGGSNLVPGACLSPKTLSAKNTGTVAGNHIQVAVVNTVTDSGNNSAPDLDSFLRLNTFTYDTTTDLIPVIGDDNLNGFTDLNDLQVSGLDGLALTDLNTNHTFNVEVCLNSNAGNDLQGDSVDSDWTVTLNQDASQ